MKIGYPCINRSIGCTSSRTFRLKSYSEEQLKILIKSNLDCLHRILLYNIDQNILFFRISSDIIPFASHPVCCFKWQKHFAGQFKVIGKLIKKHSIRISMHPDQFTLINSIDTNIFRRSVKELTYHAEILDLLNLDCSAKIQIHVGGAYGDKPKSIKRFIDRYNKLPKKVIRRLVIENDHRLFTVADCIQIHKQTKLPVLFDSFHHEINNEGESVSQGLKTCASTWSKKDGIPMVDYSSQAYKASKGSHTEHIDIAGFKLFLRTIKGIDCDIMLEIKDKERSALKAIDIAGSN